MSGVDTDGSGIAHALARPSRIRVRTLALVLALACGMAAAQPSGGTFEIPRSRVATGGGQSVGGDFTLNGTAGQHEAEPQASGGSFSLRGGFWVGIATTPPADPLFRDGFEDSP